MSPGVFEQRAARVKPEDVATIIYTSGTTGEPKGAMLTHRNFVSNVVTGCEVIPFAADALALSFLPLSHVFERMIDYAYMYKTAAIAYAESIDKLGANFLELNPYCFGAVPRVYEKVHARILAKVDAGSPLRRKLFHWAIGVGRARVAFMERGERLPPGLARKVEDRRRAGLQEDPGRARDRLRVRRLGRRAAVARPRGVLHRRGRPDLRGLRPDGDLARHLRERAGALAPGDRRARRCGASR